MTDVAQPSYHSASFSPQAGYYQLSYDGPLVPWQRVVNIGNSCQWKHLDLGVKHAEVVADVGDRAAIAFNYVLTNNEALNKTHDEFQAPIISYGTIDSDGYGMRLTSSG